ncbi:MAG: GNAT family N-acetyltransferase [Steroidobacteraceae bacterium]
MYLRRAKADDLDFIVAQESRPEFALLVGCWDYATHASNLHHPNLEYWIVESEPGQRAGFVILSGLQSPHRAIELTRIVLKDPGAGRGRQACEHVLRYVFDILGAHRLSLDVIETNERAAGLYSSLGFKREGLMREAFRRGEEYRSLILMSLLEREYRAARNATTR